MPELEFFPKNHRTFLLLIDIKNRVFQCIHAFYISFFIFIPKTVIFASKTLVLHSLGQHKQIATFVYFDKCTKTLPKMYMSSYPQEGLRKMPVGHGLHTPHDAYTNLASRVNRTHTHTHTHTHTDKPAVDTYRPIGSSVYKKLKIISKYDHALYVLYQLH